MAKRFAAAWGKAIDFINTNPTEARKYLAKNTFTPDNVVDMVSMLGYVMASDMNARQIGDCRNWPISAIRSGSCRKARRHQSPAEILRHPWPETQLAARSELAGKPRDSSQRTAPHVTIRGLSKRFSDATIYDNFDFDIPRGKLMSVFGPNGCARAR